MKKIDYNSSNQKSDNDLHVLSKDDYIALFENKKDKSRRKFKLFERT